MIPLDKDSREKHGGSAFPLVVTNMAEQMSSLPGMSLRDYFAAAALDCFHTTMNINDDEKYLGEIIRKLAKFSYMYADAMIEVRK